MKLTPAEIVSKIIRLYVTSRFSSKMEGEFTAWFASKVHRREKDRVLKDIWEKTVAIDTAPGVETQKAFRKLCDRLELKVETHDADKKRYGNGKTIWLDSRKKLLLRRIAAVMIPLLAVASAMFFVRQPEWISGAGNLTYVEIPAADTTRKIVLPDSSVMWINKGSEARYKRGFRDGRSIKLTGEGYFEVRHKNDRPFRVQTKNLLVTVLGTTFNISDYSGAQQAVVSLYEGSVNVKTNKSETLTAHNELVYTVSEQETEINEMRAVKPAWLAEPMVFVYVPLTQILNEIADKFDVEISGPTPGAADDTISIYLDGTEGLEEVLFRLAKLSGKMSFRIEDKKVIIENN